jgi:NAD(P)-dependent dehydrogenase (short-subunit alcohol dehydrogenase family)
MKTFLVTGTTDGIGIETTRQLLALGHRVILHGRSQAKVQAAAAKQKGETATVHGDLSILADVRSIAKQVGDLSPVLDGIINNAGIFMKTREVSTDSFEMTMHVNHLAPFLLTNLLLPNLKKSTESRVVNVSSMAHARGKLDVNDFNLEKHFDGGAAYCASKLANIYFTNELARRVRGTSVSAYSLHPGVITTKLLKAGFGIDGASLESGAKTSVYCATSDQLRGITGRYYSDSKEKAPGPHANNETLEKQLWQWSERAVGM